MFRFLLISLLMSNVAFGQFDYQLDYGPVEMRVPPGMAIKTNTPTKRFVPLEYVREADVLWKKRVWRSIDLRQRINHPLYYPEDGMTSTGWNTNSERYSLWSIIRYHVMTGRLTAFSPYHRQSFGLGKWDGDQLKYPVRLEEGKDFYSDHNFREEVMPFFGRLGAQSDIAEVDEYGDAIEYYDSLEGVWKFKYPNPDTIWYNSNDIVEYRIKEEWYFDNRRSEMSVRILAIAPVVHTYSVAPNGNEMISGTKELFWLYYPHCAYIFNNYFTYNDKNDSQWMSYEDLFRKRHFQSTVYKENNTYDREIQDYAVGERALRESQRVTEQIRNIENFMWSY